MISRQRAMAVFNGERPDRAPMWCGASPEFIAKAEKYLGVKDDEEVLRRFGDDFRRVFSRFCGPESFGTDSDGATTSVFGVKRAGIGYGQPTEHPLADAGLGEIEAYPWPDPNWYDVSHIKEDSELYEGRYAILGGEWSPFFHDAIDLLGMENMMILMYDEPEKVDAVMKHIVDFYYEISRRTFDAAGDAIDISFIGNDFGSQTGPLVGPAQFGRFIAPHLKRFADLAHEHGKMIQLHCCGSIAPLIPTIISCGIDALQSLQPITPDMEPKRLLEAFGNRIVFNGCVDSVRVLINGTPELVEKETREVLETMSNGARFILSASHDYILEETPVENILAMFDTGRDFMLK